ncbi:hypothetical protein pb186bvf_016981 [Paramecium bursaria]
MRRHYLDENAEYLTKLNQSPKRSKLEKKAQDSLQEISNCDLEYWKQTPKALKPNVSQKTTIDTSFRIRKIESRCDSHQENRKKRAQSFVLKEILKEANIQLYVPLKQPTFKKKQRVLKEQMKYFQGFFDKEQRIITGVNSLIVVKGLAR